MLPASFQQLAVALGLLVGLQRERADPAIAGIRTFALITVLGAVAALVLSGNLGRMSKGRRSQSGWCSVGRGRDLHLRDPLHRFVDRIGEKDIRAVVQLVLIALVILPLLPDRPFGPCNVLNPYQICQSTP